MFQRPQLSLPRPKLLPDALQEYERVCQSYDVPVNDALHLAFFTFSLTDLVWDIKCPTFLGESDLEPLLQMIKKNPHLTTLILADLGISNQGAALGII